jgi:hypothetical protein
VGAVVGAGEAGFAVGVAFGAGELIDWLADAVREGEGTAVPEGPDRTAWRPAVVHGPIEGPSRSELAPIRSRAARIAANASLLLTPGATGRRHGHRRAELDGLATTRFVGADSPVRRIAAGPGGGVPSAKARFPLTFS